MASSGNFCILNRVDFQGAISSFLSNGNLKASTGENVDAHCGGTLGINADTDTQGYYYEVRIESRANNQAVGWTRNIYYTGSYGASASQAYVMANGKGAGGGDVYTLSSENQSFRQTFSDGDIVGVAIKGGKLWFAKNNTYINSGDPAGNSGEAITGATGTLTPVWYVAGGGTNTQYFNFGQDSTFGGAITAGGNADANGFGDFKYAPPTGFLALCSANLPISDDIDPAQTDDDHPQKQFNPILWTGNGSTNNITGLGFQPDLVWTKGRSTTYNNRLWDSSRGVQKYLDSDSTDAEATLSTGLTAFGSDGFTLGSGGSQNSNGATYIAWCWRAKGGTETTNNDGNVTSYIQANTNAGFSIVRHSDSFGSSSSLGHGLGVKPDFFIHKLLADGTNMSAWHNGLSGANYIVRINTTAAEATSTHLGEPSSSVLNFGSGLSGTGAGISYCWHNVEGFQKFGSYIGNGNADGPFIYTGFRPRMFFIKNIGATSKWHVYDTARTTSNPMNDTLDWNANNAEQTNYAYQDYDTLSNGFKVRGDNGFANSSGVTYIYGAWGDVPFKYNNTF